MPRKAFSFDKNAIRPGTPIRRFRANGMAQNAAVD
jgi:hypothetical protein